MNRPDTDAQDQLSKSSFSACNARPVHTEGPLPEVGQNVGRLRRKFCEQRFRLLQIERLKTFSEPTVNRSQQFARLLHLALVAPEACEAHSFVVLPNSPRK